MYNLRNDLLSEEKSRSAWFEMPLRSIMCFKQLLLLSVWCCNCEVIWIHYRQSRARRWIEIIMKKNEGQLLSGDQITADNVSAADCCQQILSFPPANRTVHITLVWILRVCTMRNAFESEEPNGSWPQIKDVPITLSWKFEFKWILWEV